MSSDYTIDMPYLYSEFEPVELNDKSESRETIDLSDSANTSNPSNPHGLEDPYVNESDAVRFWGYGGSHLPSVAEDFTTEKIDEPFHDRYQRELEADRLEREGPPPSQEEIASILKEFGYDYGY